MEHLFDRRRFLERTALVAGGLAGGFLLSSGWETRSRAQEKPYRVGFLSSEAWPT